VKLVIDTNILVSGTLWDGPSARLVEAMESGLITVVLSADLLGEFAEVIGREKFAERLSARQITPRQLVNELARKAEIVLPSQIPVPAELRDPKDLKVLAAAIAGRVDAIITGDNDLLCRKSFRDIPILKVQVALQKLGVSAE
jgi:putative PIN family toxin of toxin-antitoxin system